ncbi:ATP-binding protein [Paenibacillus allorhizosphaerae]|uniref:Sensor histidine kinase RcsC n=1 Tax=Paenibacillus allorhizosphaerae TaxID=2849866 RepID=A0ABN7TJ13_9BACL|nr:sensor histidine kinase [Paenibacillus allorhizosphaerae]CAG7635408.1 Sensor histidine kinase RcsC [Paenibacillus allorhizosphaerae]
MFNYTIEGLLLNVFFVTSPLIFYQFLLNKKLEEKPALSNALHYSLFGVSIMLCMFFPITIQSGLQFDFRILPFIMASFYSNRTVSVALVATLVGVRFALGGEGAYLNLISSSLALLCIAIAEKKYRTLTLGYKMAVSAAISFFCKLVGIACNYLFDPEYVFVHAIMFYVVQAVFMALMVYIIESIRKSVQLRDELIESEKMKVVSVISASVAHEIRNPLTTVRGFIQLLTQTQVDQEKKRQYGKLCLDELDRAQQIINDYLSLAKPHPELNEKLNIGDEIYYVSKVLTSYANLSGVEIVVEFDVDLYVTGDRSKFRQSIINIAKNGIEAMEAKGGVLTITAKRNKRFVVLRISDIGNGMTDAQINRLGSPYFSNKEKGTGLGTMVSFNIIKGMMGRINVQSEVGRGTVFQIVFPAVS